MGTFLTTFSPRDAPRRAVRAEKRQKRKERCTRSRTTATRSLARRAQRVRRSGAIAARAHRTALAHGIHRVRSGAFLHGALLAFREHTCVSLMNVIFSACLSAVARRRRPVRLPPRHPRVLFTAT